jgi:hypothetical protein
MDGNPAAGAETIREALDRARDLALGRYRSDVRELAVALAMHRSLVEVSPELDESIARDERELPEYAGTIGRRSELEPYRRKLSFIWWRLGNDGYERPTERFQIWTYSRAAWRRTGRAYRGQSHWRLCAAASRSSVSIWPSSTCGCANELREPSARPRHSQPQPRSGGVMDRGRSTR